MKAALLDYVAAFNAADAGRVVALFADDATVEDPVGSPVVAGREAILAFYRHATSLGARLDVVAAPRGSHGNAAALSFAVYAQMQGHSGGCMGVSLISPVIANPVPRFTARGSTGSTLVCLDEETLRSSGYSEVHEAVPAPA